jgi:hypothetical protein
MRAKFATAIVLVALQPVAAPAFAQGPGSIEIFDMLVPGERRHVTPDWKTITAYPLGTRENPVRAFQPPGEREYLGRLVCPGGSRPAFRRVGSIGPGPYTSVLDDYAVTCGEVVHRIIIDMYHPGYVECLAVPGFLLRGSCSGA